MRPARGVHAIAMVKLLEGVRVLEIGQALAGPMTGLILGYLGADVIKVERPGAGDDARGWGPPFVDGVSPSFHAVNQNKRSIALDLKRPEHLRWLDGRLAQTDVPVQNLRPGVVESIGREPHATLARHPRLVYCSLSAFGHKGPLRLRPGYEPIVQAFGGLMLRRRATRHPARHSRGRGARLRDSRRQLLPPARRASRGERRRPSGAKMTSAG